MFERKEERERGEREDWIGSNGSSYRSGSGDRDDLFVPGNCGERTSSESHSSSSSSMSPVHASNHERNRETEIEMDRESPLSPRKLVRTVKTEY